MKSSARIFKSALLGFGIVSIVTVGVFADQRKDSKENEGYVTFQKNAVLIPGTKISPPDQKELNNILKKYDKSLYKIETYEKGRVVKTQGTLSDVILRHTKASEFADNAKKHGISGWADQVGLDINEQNDMATPAPKSKHNGNSEELVARVTKILRKYARK